MNGSELLKLLEGLIVISGVAAIIYALFKNTTVKTTINSQKELIETLTTQIAELRTLHIANEKSIAELRGQVSVYKELPLKELAVSMEQISKTQGQILTQLKKNINQSIGKQNVEHQHVEVQE